MSHLHALILGLVQGLTEFFPVSSSAHLKLAKYLLGAGEMPIIFDLACHLGSLAALIWFFKNEIVKLFVEDQKRLLYLFLALLPLIPSYFLLSPLRKIASQPEYLGYCLMTTGALLLLGQKIRIKATGKPLRDALLIGTMQSAALIPGISRSASTISCARILGWSPEEAVRFSFLLAIPTIVGGNMIETLHLWKNKELITLNPDYILGFAAAFLAGIVVIRFAIGWLEKGNLKPFGWYCILLGLLAKLVIWA